MKFIGQIKEKTLLYLTTLITIFMLIYSFWTSHRNCQLDSSYLKSLNEEIDKKLLKTTEHTFSKFSNKIPVQSNKPSKQIIPDVHETIDIHAQCKYNTAALIQSMQMTQRSINKLWQNLTEDADQRWNTMSELFEPISLGYRLILKPFTYYSGDENKYFVGFTDPNATCNAVTVGVGGTWRGETALRQKYPQCDFVGIDPSIENKKLVESIPRSTFVHAALYEREGNFSVLKIDPKEVKYVSETVHHQAFYHILILFGNGHTIDFMTIDTEGAEFALMKTLHTQRHLFAKICQFNLEIHYGKQHYEVSLDEFDKLFSDFLDEAHFVLLSTSRIYTMQRLWFLNVADQECVQKFLC